MNRSILLLLSLALAFVGCDRAKNDSGMRRYDARGIVRGISPDRRTITIEHENIPGFMPSMTMPFTAADPKEIARFNADDVVAFQLVVTADDAFISKLKKIAPTDVKLPRATVTPAPPPSTTARLREGDTMPFFDLTNERGEKIGLESFRGRPFVLTFLFTRCPMPNFCPRMSKNFAELQQAIRRGTGAVAETRLLSITIDPQFDTPRILAEYGKSEEADPAIWTFATGGPSQIDALTQAFAVYRAQEGGTISHGLTTALIDRNGTIAKLWRGNGWTPAEVLREIR